MSRLPSAEQRAATASKYAKVTVYQPRQAQAPQQPTVEPTEKKWSRLERFSGRVTLLAIVLLLLGAVFPHVHYTWYVPGTACGCGNPYPDGASAWYIGFAVVGGVVLVGYWMCAFWFCLARLSFQIGKDAVKPCPTPQEIEQEMRARGFSPTVADVLAVHAVKKQEQYENVAVAVGWWALWSHIGHEARGRR